MAFICQPTSLSKSSFSRSGSHGRNKSRRRPAHPRTPHARPGAPRCVAGSGAKLDEKEQAQRGEAREARIQLWREVDALKKSLTIAVNAERFADAARIRDQIQSLSLADDYFRTETELKKAVAEERFAEAARLRDALNLLDPPPGMAVLRGEMPADAGKSSKPLAEMAPEDVNTSSETTTDGVVVRIESYYMAEQSLPEQNRFLFGYKVNITNNSSDTCQLVSRHWVIDNSAGPESEVKGPGVVGRQPVLEPGESFEYTSACPITVSLQAGQSVVGSMKGSYEFCKGSTGAIKFHVKIDPFFFKLPFRNYRPPGSSPPGKPWSKP